jgi:Domain of unknown function (DUF4145)
MKCPHCNVGIHDKPNGAQIAGEVQHYFRGEQISGRMWIARHQLCPECAGTIIHIECNIGGASTLSFLSYPPNATTRPVPPEVTDPYKQDFIEACNVLRLSAKASAALSRRNVQAILRDKAKTKKKDLFDQIEEVISSGSVPSYISDGLHGVRVVGNFAAHSLKSTHSGEIIDVEDNEAEWNLDVLERMFDFYFVQPAIAAKRKEEINKKLKEAGKPEIP